jgi:hypothetical protein
MRMSIKNKMIVLNRGDTYEFDLTIDDGYRLQEDDTVYMGIMDPHHPFEAALVKKRFTADEMDDSGKIHIVIEPEDTVDLLPGTYYYAVKLHLQHGEVDKVRTLINKTKLFLND